MLHAMAFFLVSSLRPLTRGVRHAYPCSARDSFVAHTNSLIGDRADRRRPRVRARTRRGARRARHRRRSRDMGRHAARGKTRDIDFTTSEGTWMSADLSPDRTWLVFDLLGHVYRMPATGGEATVLTQSSGVALNFQPRISPDGKTIAFITDRRGQYNLWVMNADGIESASGVHRSQCDGRSSRRGRPTAITSSSARADAAAAVRPAHQRAASGCITRTAAQGVQIVGAECAAGRRGRPARTARRHGPPCPSDGRYLYYQVSMTRRRQGAALRIDPDPPHGSQVRRDSRRNSRRE